MSKTTISLICVFLFLGVIAYFILPRGEERITSYKGLDVDLTIDSALASKIEIQRPGKSIIIENLDGKWTITSPDRYAANSSTIAQLLGGLKKFKVGSLISSNPKTQNMFQVDSTGTTLTVTDRTGKSISMVIGRMGPSFSDLYFRLPNSNGIYLGEGIATWILNQELKDWQDKTIFSMTSDSIRPEKPRESRGAPEKEYAFFSQGGKKISASVFPATEYGTNRRIVIFAPFLDYSGGNFYQASLQALHQIFGKRRGLFQLDDAQKVYDSIIDAKVIYWTISNPTQRFYCFPIIDTDTDKIASIVVWIV